MFHDLLVEETDDYSVGRMTAQHVMFQVRKRHRTGDRDEKERFGDILKIGGSGEPWASRDVTHISGPTWKWVVRKPTKWEILLWGG